MTGWKHANFEHNLDGKESCCTEAAAIVAAANEATDGPSDDTRSASPTLDGGPGPGPHGTLNEEERGCGPRPTE